MYVKSERNWKMVLTYTSNGVTTYDDQNVITYHMKYDSDNSGGISNGDNSISTNINGTDPVCILSLKSGVPKHRFAIGFAIDDQLFSKSGSFEDKLRFTISIDNNPNASVNGCIISNSNEAINP